MQLSVCEQANASKWIRQKPLGTLMIQRLVMEVMRRYLSVQFKVSGDDWSVEQDCLGAEAVAAGVDPSTVRSSRIEEGAWGGPRRMYSDVRWGRGMELAAACHHKECCHASADIQALVSLELCIGGAGGDQEQVPSDICV